MNLKIGTKVRTKDNKTTRAWGYENQDGEIIGLDPDGYNLKVWAIRLKSGHRMPEIKGLHEAHFDVRQP